MTDLSRINETRALLADIERVGRVLISVFDRGLAVFAMSKAESKDVPLIYKAFQETPDEER